MNDLGLLRRNNLSLPEKAPGSVLLVVQSVVELHPKALVRGATGTRSPLGGNRHSGVPPLFLQHTINSLVFLVLS